MTHNFAMYELTMKNLNKENSLELLNTREIVERHDCRCERERMKIRSLRGSRVTASASEIQRAKHNTHEKIEKFDAQFLSHKNYLESIFYDPARRTKMFENWRVALKDRENLGSVKYKVGLAPSNFR